MRYLSYLIWAALASTAPPPDTSLLRIERNMDAMGTTYTVVAYGKDRYILEDAVDSAMDEAKRLDHVLSNYRPDSDWSIINRDAAKEPVHLSNEEFDLLSYCYDVSSKSNGAFDITVGPLMKLWGFYKSSGKIPHRAEVRTVLTRVGYRHMHLDRAAQTIRFDVAGVEIDPGGIGKGYAVDRMADILKRKGITSGFISGGRSSMYGLGSPPQEPRGWRVALPDPRDARKTLAEVFLRNESMSTSGTSEKFFVAGGKTYSHIMDPRTGYPVEGMLSVSVIAARTLDSEAWTKPYFVNGKQWAIRNKPKEFRVFMCEDRMENSCAFLP